MQLLTGRTAMLESIQWPDKYLPGTTDHFVSNEDIAKGAPVPAVWKALIDPLLWPKFYKDILEAAFVNAKGPNLNPDSKFTLKFNLGGQQVMIDCEVIEFMDPATHMVGRLSWHGHIKGDPAHELNFVQAWLVEPLEGDRTRLLSQLSLIGKPAQEDAKLSPDPLLIGRQEWVNGIIDYAKKNK